VQNLKKIFVVLEPGQEEQPALERAAYIAEATGAALHLFMCAYDRAIGIATFLSGSQRSTFVQTIVDGSQVMVDRFTVPLIEKEIPVTTEVVWDRHASDAIVAAAAEDDYDLLMKCGRHIIRADRMFNHIDLSVVRYSPCPVMLVKKGQWDEVGQVLAAIDAAPENEIHESLNRQILDRASYLATELNFELHLVCAYPAPPVFVPVSKVTASLLNYRSKMSKMVLDNLRKLGEEYAVLEAHQHAIEGPVDWVIPKVSAEIVAEFVVMGNVSREGLTGISIGSTAETILDQLNTNVLMVRVSEKPGS
jgi:universal stress protein E